MEHRREWAGVMYGIGLEEQKRVDEKAGRPGKPHGSLQCGTSRRPVSSDARKKSFPFSARGVLWYQGESDEDMRIYTTGFSRP